MKKKELGIYLVCFFVALAVIFFFVLIPLGWAWNFIVGFISILAAAFVSVIVTLAYEEWINRKPAPRQGHQH